MFVRQICRDRELYVLRIAIRCVQTLSRRGNDLGALPIFRIAKDDRDFSGLSFRSFSLRGARLS